MSTYILKRLAEAVGVCSAFRSSPSCSCTCRGSRSAPPVHRSQGGGRRGPSKESSLDQPLYVQYWIFLQGLLRLDFGQSLFIREPAITLVLERFPATMSSPWRACSSPYNLHPLESSRRSDVLTAGQHLHRSGGLGPSHAHLLAGLDAHHLLAVQLRILPPRPGDIPAPSHACVHVGGCPCPHHHAHDPVEDAGHPVSGFIRTARAKGVREQLSSSGTASECVHPHRHHPGVAVGRLLGGAIVTETVFACRGSEVWPYPPSGL